MTERALFKAMQDERMLERYCAVFDAEGEICYVGHIKDAPEPPRNGLMILHPADFAKLSAWFNQYNKPN